MWGCEMCAVSQAEEAMERWAAKHIKGDSFICACGKSCKLDDGVQLSPNPYFPPVCPDCAMKDPAYAKWCADQPGEAR